MTADVHEITTQSWARSLLRPRSVAIIGASDRILTFTGAPIHNLETHGYNGRIYPVNPKRDTVQGRRAYASVLDIPDPVEAAVVCVPTNQVMPVLRECEQKGVMTATVISSGFEVGAGTEGTSRRRELEEFLASARLRVLGPNTAGLLNAMDDYVPRAAVNHVPPEDLRIGPVAVVTQSGACSNILFNRAQANAVAVGTVVATGDEADLDVWDVTDALLDDERVACVLVIIEGFKDAAKARAVGLKSLRFSKPIMTLQLGRSDVGQDVVLTHSGSLAGDVETIAAALEEWGFVPATSFDEMWEFAKLVEAWGPPLPIAGRLGLFAFSGGEAALVADHAAEAGITLGSIDNDFADVVDQTLSYAKAANPFDATGELVGRPEKLRPVLTSFLEDNDFTSVLIATPVYRQAAADRTLPHLTEVLTSTTGAACPRIVCSMWPSGILTDAQALHLEAAGRPVIHGSDRAVAAIARYESFGASRGSRLLRLEGSSLVADEGTPRGIPRDESYFAARDHLMGLGLPFGAARWAEGLDDLLVAADRIGYPVVLKANVTSTVHKSGEGLVRVGLVDDAALQDALAEVGRRAAPFDVDGMVVEAMAYGNIELIIGMNRDPLIGPVLVFGMGGSMAEYLGGHVIAPLDGSITANWASGVAVRAGVGKFLAEQFPGVLQELAEHIAVVGRWFATSTQVRSVDLNPVLLDTTTGRLTFVDARIERMASGTATS